MKQYQTNRYRHGCKNARQEAINILSKERKEYAKKIKQVHEDILKTPSLGKLVNYRIPENE